MTDQQKKIAIIGAGPAGLTAAYLLGEAGMNVTVFEKDAQYVGGISRTEKYKGYLFDIGGHRFFSKRKEVEDFWTNILGDEMIERPRSSRIFYNKKFFAYPLSAMEALTKLGIFESARCVSSYLKARLTPIKNPNNFEDWVTNQFGKRLFNIFFKTYTEKVWGINTKEISADWAAQRIKGLSLKSAILHAISKPKQNNKDQQIKTLIDSFRYPKYGPGQMWEVCAAKAKAFGVQLQMKSNVESIALDMQTKQWSVTVNGIAHAQFDYVISSAPIALLLPKLSPNLPSKAFESAKALKYRDFLTIVLILKERNAFADNWIYIHDPSVQVGRIQNFKSWSPYMVPDADKTCYGLEYFCFEGDGLWNAKDEDLLALAKKEIVQIGLANEEDIVDGTVVRQAKAYPVYDQTYAAHVDNIKEALKAYKGLYLVGRNGMHKYNNQDHSMMTAMLAAKNIIAGEELFDLWNVNQDAEYHESGERSSEGGRLIPQKT
jgi:protoporphyrinogen oxidase